MAKTKIARRDRPTVKAQCLRLLVILKLDPAKMQLISGFVDTYLNLNPQEKSIFQSEISTIDLEEREQIMQITTTWEQKGIVKGREEGKVEGQSNTILRLLNRKLGNLPEEISTQIKSLEQNQLDLLTEDLLDFATFDDLDRWLNNL
jgi:predicted transposase YdaD